MTPQRAKEIGIIVAVILQSLATFGLAGLFVSQGRFSTTSVLVVLALLAILWVALVALALAVVQHPGSSAAVVIGICVSLAIAGLGQLPALAAALLLAVFLGFARRLIYREINNRVLYRTGEAFGKGVRAIIFAAGLAAVGLAWGVIEHRLSPTEIRVPDSTIKVVVERVVPNLPAHLSQFLDINQLTVFVTTTVNQSLQSAVATYRWIFLLIVLLLAISAWRALIPLIAWLVIPVIAALVYLARQAGIVYLSRSQATIERLHL